MAPSCRSGPRQAGPPRPPDRRARAGSRVRQPFALSGWALDATAPTPGIDTLHVWAFPDRLARRLSSLAWPTTATAGRMSRPIYGPQFGATGFNLTVKGLAPGDWSIAVYGWVTATQTSASSRRCSSPSSRQGSSWSTRLVRSRTVDSTFVLGGWAVDSGAARGHGRRHDPHLGIPGRRVGAAALRRRAAVRRPT